MVGNSDSLVDGGNAGLSLDGESITFTLTAISGPGGTIEINEVNLFGFDPDSQPPPFNPNTNQGSSLFDVENVDGSITDQINSSGNPTGDPNISNHTFANLGGVAGFTSRGGGASFNKLFFDFDENATDGGGADGGGGGAGGGGGSAAIPEPSSFALCLLCGCFGFRRRRKRLLT